MNIYNILVCEDDITIGKSIKIFLENNGYKVFNALNGKEAIDIFKEEKIHLVLMDLMMPKLSGEEAIVELRKESYVPIIILSAKSEEEDMVNGLNIGADDYITKPFNSNELVARVNSAIRRFYRYIDEDIQGDKIEVNGVFLDLNKKLIEINGKEIPLTSLEFEILKLLMNNPGRIFSMDEIYERVWNEPAIESKTVSVHIRRIREKIEIDPKNPRYLKVAWGVGYKFEGN
ncbi:response regulator transcription factor [Lagierella sp.]|uniref:response regulator transcription factor n=1 Tax=Lagierella sp. TaxID=2849657 RepID=UPI002631C63C|nr:response regulator transcription factor [Lagierella sp.]